MVKRAGKEVIPIEVYKENYDVLKEEAKAKGKDTKAFVNHMLQHLIQQQHFLKENFPGLSIEAVAGDRTTLKDVKNREFIDVYLRVLDLYCDKDKTSSCIHTKYLWLLPELASLFESLEIAKIDMNKVKQVRNAIVHNT